MVLINLSFIFLSALSLMHCLTESIEFALTPVIPKTTRRPAVQTDAPSSPNVSSLGKLTGLPWVPVDPAYSKQMPTEPVRTRLPLILLGTLTGEPREWAMAAVLMTETHQVKTLMVGDSILNGQIVDIEQKRVRIHHDGVEEFIDTTTAAPPAVSVPRNEATAAFATRLTENEYEVSQVQVQRALNRLDQLAQDAYIIPVSHASGLSGFKLVRIRPGSLYTQLGIESGDILTRINGYELSGPEKALEAYMQLRDASRIELEFIRNGVTRKARYAIR